MKLKILLGMMTVLACFSSAFAKTVVVVEPDKGVEIGALNKAIAMHKDTVIYELKRDAIYYLNGQIATAWPLHIRAQAGTGKRPILQPAVDDNGVSTRHFSLGGNTKLEGLFIAGTDDMGNINKNLIRVEKKDVRLELTDCVIDYDTQCPIRLQVSGVKAYVKDCILRNIVNVNEPGDGKLIDTRGNRTDSIVFENNTVYHTSDLVARIDDAFVRYFKFDHNTFYLTGDGFDLSIILEVEITNNIFYNMNWQGSDTTAASSPEAFIKCDSLFTLDNFTDADRKFKITNNNIFLEQKYIDAMSQGKYVAPVFDAGVCSYFIKSGQMDTTKTIHEALVFDNPPPAPMDYINAWHTSNGNLIGLVVPNFYADKDPVNVGGEDEYSFNYNANSKSAKASTTGGPLGSTRWHVTGTSAVDEIVAKSSFSVYPNPASDKVYLSFTERVPESFILSIYNMHGIKVKEQQFFENAVQGKVEVNISAINSGVYVYRIVQENGKVLDGKLLIQK